MSVLARLEEEIKTAMKSRDQVRLQAVRLIKTNVKNKEIELIRPLTEPEFLALLATMAKKVRESIDQFRAGGRAELVAKEEGELAIIESFLPKALDEAELTKMISDAIASSGAKGPKDMGLVMKALKDSTTGRVDGKILSEKVKNQLASLT